MKVNHRGFFYISCAFAIVVSVFFYKNDNRIKDMPSGDVIKSGNFVTVNIDNCHVIDGKLKVSGWIAVKYKDELQQAYLSSNITKGAMDTQSYRDYDVTKALQLPGNSAIRFSSGAVIKNVNKDKNIIIKVLSKSKSGKIYGGNYECK